jgi:transposase
MCIQIPKTISEERLRWILPIHRKEMRIDEVMKVCPHGKRTLERWLSEYRKHGKTGLEPESTRPKTNPKETPIHIKEEVLNYRRETKLCALKMKWRLQKKGIKLHERTIHKIIKAEGLERKYRIRKTSFKKPKTTLMPGEMIEIDVKFVPDRINGKRYYQFTAIDCASRWRYLKIYEQQCNIDAIDFLDEVTKRFPYQIKAIKTDNGSIFTNRYTGYLKSIDPINPRLHPFDLECKRLGAVHYLIDPGKPAQNGHVEKSHGFDQDHFYDEIKCKTEEDLRYQIKLWNMWYNDLEHISLNGKTPLEALKLTN